MKSKVTAIVLAAGRSKRMGQPKMLLPWSDTTVLGQVLSALRAAGMTDILVVTGAEHEAVERIAGSFGAQTAHNAQYAQGEMLSSVQCALSALKNDPLQAALICLGDQPQVEERTVRGVVKCFLEGESALVAPSYNLRRGHPWLVAHPLWTELMALRAPQSLRDFLNAHADEIKYFAAESDTIFADVDTPDDYQNAKPANSK